MGNAANKLAFYSSPLDKNMPRALFDRRFHTVPPMAWCENIVVSAEVKFLATPARDRSLFYGKHGIYGGIGADFEPMHKGIRIAVPTLFCPNPDNI